MSEKTRRLCIFGYAVFVCVLPVAYGLWLVKLSQTGDFFYSLTSGGFHYIDYVSFYRCGKLVASAAPQMIYDPAVQLAAYNQIIAPLHVLKAPFSEYLPWTFLLMAPFAMFSLPISYLLWNLASSLFGLYGLDQLLRAGNWVSAKQRAIFLLAVLSFYPCLRCLHNGQNSFFLVGAIALFCKYMLEKKDIKAGIFLALTSVKPQYFVFLIVPALAKKRIRLLGSVSVSLLVLLSLSICIFSLGTVLAYPKTLATSAGGDILSTWNCSVRGVLSMALGRSSALVVSAGLNIMSIGLLFNFWRKTDDKRVPLLLAITMVAMLVVSLHTQAHDLTLLAVPAALTIPSALSSPATKNQPLNTWTRLFIAFPLVGFALFFITDRLPIAELMSVVFLLLDVVLLCSGIHSWRRNSYALPTEQ